MRRVHAQEPVLQERFRRTFGSKIGHVRICGKHDVSYNIINTAVLRITGL
jgi:hypothetical protein